MIDLLPAEVVVRLCVRDDYLQSGIALSLLRAVCTATRSAVNEQVPAVAWSEYAWLLEASINAKAYRLRLMIAQAACAAAMPSLVLYHRGDRYPTAEDLEIIGWRPTETRMQMTTVLTHYANGGCLESLGRLKRVLGRLIFNALIVAFGVVAHNRDGQVDLFRWAVAESLMSDTHRSTMLAAVSRHPALHSRLLKSLDEPPILTVTDRRRKLPASFGAPRSGRIRAISSSRWDEFDRSLNSV